ncbi:putative IQ domain-containing protein G [Trypoxylus dichotomus]
MLDTAAFPVKDVQFTKTPGDNYERIIDHIMEDYEVHSSKEEVDSSESEDVISVYNTTDESIVVRSVCCLFLSECLDKLAILKVMTREKVDSGWYKNVRYRPPEQRFTVEDEEFDMYEYTNNRKLTKLICTLQNILHNTLVDVERFGSATYFLQTVTNMEKKETDAVDLYQDFTNNLQDLILYNRKLHESYKKNKQLYTLKTNDFHRVEQSYENMILLSKIERGYVDKWEDNRCYLSGFLNDSREKQLRDEIQEYEKKIAHENRVHNEICIFMEHSMRHSSVETDNWLERYDRDLEALEGRIYEIKINIEQCETSFKLMDKEYESRALEIEDWLRFKEKLRKEEEELLNRNIAAIRVQAWWRGVMVRRHLGSYKKQKKRKGKGGQKGTNKKKGKRGPKTKK